MTVVRLKHIDRFRDRHGRWRHYFRHRRGGRICLPGKPGSPEFMAAYQAALERQSVEAKPKDRRADSGTFNRLVRDYFASPDFLRLAPSTQRAYRGVIERLMLDDKIGHRKVAEMQRAHVQKIVAKRAATPGAANDVLKKLKILTNFAIDNGWRRDNPCTRIKKFASGEFHTWTDDEIAKFEKRWPIGSRARTAFALLVFTGQRASDVAKMRWADTEAGGIWVMQLKTKAKLLVPLHPELRKALSAWGVGDGPILKTSFDKAFTSKGFSNFMADRIDDAGLPERCVTHGLRKAAARRLAEAGASANEIAAITGHVTLAEVSRYTKAAEQKTLAQSAIRLLSKHSSGAGFPNLASDVGNPAEKCNEINAEFADWRPVGESNPCFQRERLTS